jgi:small subunit ribosomal protein S4
MGDPKKARKKYSTPIHPWRKESIELEKALTKEFGFKNKKEIWKISSLLKNFSKQAKDSIVAITNQGEIEKKNLIERLIRLGLIKQGGQIDDILSLTVRDICERRLQTLIVRKNLARSLGQARQFIVHGHISIGNKKVTSPSYLITVEEESQLCYTASSALTNDEHPERFVEKKVVGK